MRIFFITALAGPPCNNMTLKSEWSISGKVVGPGIWVDQKWPLIILDHKPLLFLGRPLLSWYAYFHLHISFLPHITWRVSLRSNNVLSAYSVAWIIFKVYHDKTWINLKLPWNYLFGRHPFTPGNCSRQFRFFNFIWMTLRRNFENVFVFGKLRNLCLMSHTVYDLACY